MQRSMQHKSICGVIMVFINQIILFFNVSCNLFWMLNTMHNSFLIFK